MEKPAKFVAKAAINGKDVSFFMPPHDEPDFLWVDLEELAAAFLPLEDAKRLVRHTHQFVSGARVVTTAVNGDRIATIASHSMAQGMCGFIDQLNGHENDREEVFLGPAHIGYCAAAADVEYAHRPGKTFEDIFAAFKNNGGPFMRNLRDE